MASINKRNTERMIYQKKETREIIISAARDLFVSNGFFETQMKDIAEKSEISRTSLYRYFRDKSDIALSILQLVYKEVCPDGYIKELEASNLTPPDKLKKYMVDVWLNTEHKSSYLFMAEFDAYYTGNRVPENFISSLTHIFYDDPERPALFGEQVMAKGIKEGYFYSNLEPALATATLLNSIRGLHQRTLLRENLLIETGSNETSAELSAEMLKLQLEWLMKAITC